MPRFTVSAAAALAVVALLALQGKFGAGPTLPMWGKLKSPPGVAPAAVLAPVPC